MSEQVTQGKRFPACKESNLYNSQCRYEKQESLEAGASSKWQYADHETNCVSSHSGYQTSETNNSPRAITLTLNCYQVILCLRQK